MHSNQQTIAGLFSEATPTPELDQAIRDVFRTAATRLAELLPTNPNATFTFRVLRQAQDAALLTATDTRNSSATLPTGPAPASASVSSSASSSTPASSPSSGRPPGPEDTEETHQIVERVSRRVPAILAGDGAAPTPATASRTPRHRPPGESRPQPQPNATGPGTPEVLGPDGAPLKR